LPASSFWYGTACLAPNDTSGHRLATLKPLRLLLYVAPLVLLLLLVPYLTAPYQAYLLSYGLIMAIARWA